jgi:hypothetical protein
MVSRWMDGRRGVQESWPSAQAGRKPPCVRGQRGHVAFRRSASRAREDINYLIRPELQQGLGCTTLSEASKRGN